MPSPPIAPSAPIPRAPGPLGCLFSFEPVCSQDTHCSLVTAGVLCREREFVILLNSFNFQVHGHAGHSAFADATTLYYYESSFSFSNSLPPALMSLVRSRFGGRGGAVSPGGRLRRTDTDAQRDAQKRPSQPLARGGLNPSG